MYSFHPAEPSFILRSSLTKQKVSKAPIQHEPQAKRRKVDHAPQNMIELDIVSSDDEHWQHMEGDRVEP